MGKLVDQHTRGEQSTLGRIDCFFLLRANSPHTEYGGLKRTAPIENADNHEASSAAEFSNKESKSKDDEESGGTKAKG